MKNKLISMLMAAAMVATLLPATVFASTTTAIGGANFIDVKNSGIADVTVSFNSNGGSYVNPVTMSVGSSIDPYKYIPTKSGYAFGGWYLDSGLTQLVTANTRFNANVTVYVRWLEDANSIGSVGVAGTTPPPQLGGGYHASWARGSDVTGNPQTGDSWFANLFA